MYARQVGEKTLSLGVSGNLWKDVLVLYDRETDSLWTQLNGTAIQGPMAGKGLEEVPSEMTTWADWRARHPHTAVLKKDRIEEGSRYDGYAKNQEMLGIFGTKNPDDRLGGKDLIYGVKLPDGAVAVAESRLQQDGGVTVQVGKTRLLFTESGSGGVAAYVLPAGADDVSVEKRTKGDWQLSDGTVIDTATGVMKSGPAKGTTLERLPVTRAYWFAWATFYPRSQLVEGPVKGAAG